MKKITIFIVGILLFNFASLNAMAFTYGDADGNDMLNATDAAMLLQKALKNHYILPIENIEVDYIQVIDVNNDNIISALDCSYILQKVLNNSFIMPCEKYTSSEDTTETTTTNSFNIEISIGEQLFTGKLYDNSATRVFIKQLPITLNMNELNGNEKYYYTNNTYPQEEQKVGNIDAGDLMLYGNNCIVLFYENFSTSYNYTPLGKIDNVTQLKEVLGSGSAKVTFKKIK